MIKKPSELVNDTIRIRMLIAGFPGMGKTTFGLSAPRPLHIDVDLGATRINPMHRCDTIQPENYQELLNDLKPENLADYDTLVFDTGGALFELMKPYLIRQDAKNGKRDGNLSQQGYGAAGKEFRRLMDFTYCQLKKHIVMIFHAKEEKDGENTKLRIMIEGQTKNVIWQPMDLGGFMEMQGDTRIIGFSNCERYFAKGTHGIKGIRKIPELTANTRNDFLTKIFAEVQENIQEETKIFEKQKAKYEALMESFDFENTEVNELMMQIKTAKHILTSEKELKERFKQKIKKEGYIFNKETGKYELEAKQQIDEAKIEGEKENKSEVENSQEGDNNVSDNSQSA